MVIVVVVLTVPPYGILGLLVHHNVLVFGRASGVYAGHYIESTELSLLSFLVTVEFGTGFLIEQHLVGGIVNNLLDVLDAVLLQTDL